MISLKEAFIRSVTENTFELYHGSEVFITIMRTKPKCKSNLETLLHGVIAKLRVFGVYLEDLIATESNNNGTNIPEIADTFMEFIEEHGFNCEGIFRLSGKASVMAALKEALDNRSKGNQNKQTIHSYSYDSTIQYLITFIFIKYSISNIFIHIHIHMIFIPLFTNMFHFQFTLHLFSHSFTIHYSQI